MPRGLASADYRRRAGGLYDAGVENLYFWDTSPYKPGVVGGTAPAWGTLTRFAPGARPASRSWRQPPAASATLDGWSFETYGTGE